MATIKQIQTAVERFIDTQVAEAYTGIEKVILRGGTTLIVTGIPRLLKLYASHPLLTAIGVYDEENGVIDIDAIYNAFVLQMGTEKLPINLPKIGKIDLGTIMLGKDDFDILYKYIREA